MPATSEKQKKFMDAAAHNPKFAKQAGVPMKVAEDFSESSKGMKFGRGVTSQPMRQGINSPKTNHGAQALFSKGGKTMASKMNPGFLAMMAKKKDSGKKMAEGGKADMKQDKAMVKKAVGMHDKQQHMGKKTNLAALKKGGMTKMARGGGVETKGKTQGKMVTMKYGGKC
jgi:hypothetical protein